MTEYEDKSAIVEVLNLYGFALDAREWDLFDRIFTADVIAEFGPAGAAWSGLDVFKRSFAEFHDRLDSHQHTMMGQLVHVDGDKAKVNRHELTQHGLPRPPTPRCRRGP